MRAKFLSLPLTMVGALLATTPAFADDVNVKTTDSGSTHASVHTKTKKSDAKKTDKKTGASGAVEKANDKADTAADEANRDVVGDDQMNDNERKARDPRERPARKDADDEPSDTAKAIGQTTTTAANTVDTAVRDTTRATDKPGDYKPFSVEVNPLGLIVGGRVSLQAEWAPATHHAVVVSPHFVHAQADVAQSGNTTATQTYTGFGGEVGYRYYTGHRGMNGVFVGPSLIGGVYNAALPAGDQAFTNVGVAADVGVQEIFFDHLVVGGGVGVEYLKVSKDFGDLPDSPSTIASSGVKPRLLLSGGYAF